MNRLESRPTRRTLVAALACVTVLVAAFCWLVIALDHRADSEAVDTARADLGSQAREVVAAVFTVHRATWRTDRESAREVVADPLATTLAPALAVAPPDGVTSIEWTPLTTAIVDVDGAAGSALLTVRVTVTPTSGAPQSATRTVRADFTRTGDAWLLSGLDQLT